MITTDSGLQYEDTTAGSGAEAHGRPARHRALHRLALQRRRQGRQVRQQQGPQRPVRVRPRRRHGDPGWDEGVQGMKVGGTRRAGDPAGARLRRTRRRRRDPAERDADVRGRAAGRLTAAFGMPVHYDIIHTTVYRYAKPVTFGEHRVMFRPRDSHDLRVLATDLEVSPEADGAADPGSALQLGRAGAAAGAGDRVEDRLQLHHRACAQQQPRAAAVAERRVLPVRLHAWRSASTSSTTCARTTTTRDGQLTAWARQFIRTDGPTGTRDLLVQMNQHIRDNFALRRARRGRHAERRCRRSSCGSGSCRDFALLMMEAARRLGVATRFVSGYLYDPALDGVPRRSRAGRRSARARTHAWLQAYLPGAGWVPFDPTNNLLGGNHADPRRRGARPERRPRRSRAAGSATPMPTSA